MCSLYNVQAGLYIICVSCLHISLLSSGPTFLIYIEVRSSLAHTWTHNNMNFFLILRLIVCSYPVFVVYNDFLTICT